MATQEVKEPDLKTVLDELHTASTRWYEIGISLDLQSHVLDSIRADFKSTNNCFREMVKEWLSSGTASWMAMRKALQSPTVRHNSLAKKLELRHFSQSSEDAPAGRQLSQSDSIVSTASSYTSAMSTEIQDIIPYGCGCGECTFTSFIDEGCPNPRPSTSSFPFLNSEELTDYERLILHGRLYDEYEQIVRKFSILTTKVCESLMDRNVPVAKLVRVLRDLKAFEPVKVNYPLLHEQFPELRKAEDIDTVFDILADYTSFFSYQLIEHIVSVLGVDDDKAALATYKEHFTKYCKRSLFECPTFSPLKKGRATLVLKIECEEIESGNLKLLSQFTIRILKILCLGKHALSLCTVEKGCVQLVYQMSDVVGTYMPTLSRTQLTELSREGVVTLICGKQKYSCQVHQHPMLKDCVFPPLTEEPLLPVDPPLTEDPPPVPIRSTSSQSKKSVPAALRVIPESEILDKFEWYHGFISRKQAEERLQLSGDESFLIRRKNESGLYALSDVYKGQVKHYIVKKNNGVYENVYQLDHSSFNTIPQMVKYLKSTFFSQVCRRTSEPSNTIDILESDWIAQSTSPSISTPSTTKPFETADYTGDSAYGTGDGGFGTGDETGFHTALPLVGKKAESKYTRLSVEGIEPDKPYTRLTRSDDYTDYKDIGQFKQEHSPSDSNTRRVTPPPIYDRVFDKSPKH